MDASTCTSGSSPIITIGLIGILVITVIILIHFYGPGYVNVNAQILSSAPASPLAAIESLLAQRAAAEVAYITTVYETFRWGGAGLPNASAILAQYTAACTALYATIPSPTLSSALSTINTAYTAALQTIAALAASNYTVATMGTGITTRTADMSVYATQAAAAMTAALPQYSPAIIQAVSEGLFPFNTIIRKLYISNANAAAINENDNISDSQLSMANQLSIMSLAGITVGGMVLSGIGDTESIIALTDAIMPGTF